ncbi:SBBP repeat-containing protein, partial [Thermodesulfobacteriota bacterium]
YNGPGNGDDWAFVVEVDEVGNAYVTGRSIGVGTSADFTTIKYDIDGNEEWVARYNGPANTWDDGIAIALDGSGHVYVVGVASTSDGADFATIRYTDNGNSATQDWVDLYAGPGVGPNLDEDIGRAIVVDGSGNVYVTGESQGDGTTYDYCTIKYDEDGNRVWVNRHNGPGNYEDRSKAIVLDSVGDVYVTGHAHDTDADIVTIKHDPATGAHEWLTLFDVNREGAYAMHVDDAGNVYLTGDYWAGGNSDFATLKYVPCKDCLIDDFCYDDQEVNPANACEICEVTSSMTSWSDNDGASCNDGEFCTVDDVCQGGVCGFGISNDCSDGVMCTDDTCDEVNDICIHVSNDANCTNEYWCDGAETCDEVNDCQAGTDPCPDDGLWCNGEETCDEIGDLCDAANVPDCVDAVDCTVDSCNEETDTCDHAPDDVLCDNGAWCDGAETCDEAAGCLAVNDIECDDGIPCTDDYCDEGSDQCDGIDNCAEISVYLDCPTNGIPEDPVTVSVEISDAGGIDALGFDLSYDAGIFAYTGFGTTGCLLDGWVAFDCVEDSGIVSCDGSSETPLDPGSNGCLVELDFNVLPGTAGSSTELSIDALLEDLFLMSTTPCSIYIGECMEDWECEDGLFCNGTDTCLDGTCTHSGNPCDPVTQVCNEDLEICEDLECWVGYLCVTCYLNGHWTGSGYRPDTIDIELHSDMDSPAALFSGIPLDEDCVASVELVGIEDGLYEVVVRHANHIDLVSTEMVSLSLTGSNAVDFSDPASVACGESALIWEASNGGKWTVPGGDASGDGNVNIFDYFSMGQQWGGAGPESDYTGDGAVNIFDYFVLGQNWGRGMCPDVP